LYCTVFHFSVIAKTNSFIKCLNKKKILFYNTYQRLVITEISNEISCLEIFYASRKYHVYAILIPNSNRMSFELQSELKKKKKLYIYISSMNNLNPLFFTCFKFRLKFLFDNLMFHVIIIMLYTFCIFIHFRYITTNVTCKINLNPFVNTFI